MTSKARDHLFLLIKSLEKAEKRNFKLYAQRSGSKEMKFLQLFDILDQMKQFDEAEARQQMSGMTPSQFANTKRNLSAQIMKSLRLIYSEKEIDIQINEQLDYAKILYSKGFYLESLKILEKLKTLLRGANRDILLLETVEFQKLIELRHITRSRGVKNKMENLIEESVEINRKVANLSKLATLNINIQGMYIKVGHIRNDRDAFFTKNYFYSNLPNYDMQDVSFFEKVLVYQSFVWYHYMSLNFPYCYKNAKKWVDLFHTKPHMIELDAGLYLRGLHYVLTCLFYLDAKEEFGVYFKYMKDFEQNHSKHFSISTQVLHFTYGRNAELNYNFLHNDFEANVDLEQTIDDEISNASFSLDSHRSIIFKYKIGWSLFLLERYDEAKSRFSEILNDDSGKLRADTFCYAKVLMLLCHFECREYLTVQNQIQNLRKYLMTNNELNESNSALLTYVNYCSKNTVPRDEEKRLQLVEKLLECKSDKYERRAFIYFNYLDWAEKSE